MIVIGADTHKATHTCAAVDGATGQLAGELTAAARKAGFMELLAWGRELDPERVWAIEDCRHVSGALECFLVAAGEQVVRVPPKLMGQSRRGERSTRKSDPIDALAVARAALRGGTRDAAGRPPGRRRAADQAPARPPRGHHQGLLSRPAAAALAPARPLA